MDEIELRPLMPDDADAVRALIVARLAGTRYEARTLEQLDVALSFEDPEYMGLLATEPDSGHIEGLTMFGAVAGAKQVTKVHALLGDEGTCAALAAAVRLVASDSGERMVVAEVPDHRPFRDAVLALRASGFNEEGTVADFVADGIGLRLLVWRAS